MVHSSRAETRHQCWRHALRRRKICHDIYSTDYGFDGSNYYDNLHQYSKNKIHCSCGACRAKTRNKGPRKRRIHGNYSPNINWDINDLRRIESMQQELNEVTYEQKEEETN